MVLASLEIGFVGGLLDCILDHIVSVEKDGFTFMSIVVLTSLIRGLPNLKAWVNILLKSHTLLLLNFSVYNFARELSESLYLLDTFVIKVVE